MTTPDSLPRRRLLRAGALAGAGVGIGAGAGALGARALDERAAPEPEEVLHGQGVIPFHGPHQAGIETPAPAHATFLGLDLREETDRDGVLRLLRVLTADAARLTGGHAPLADTEPELAAVPARLTVTAGFGPGLLARAGRETPPWLAPLPAFPIDALDPAYCDGDLMLQVAADDPLALAHAVRMLLKGARSSMRLRWLQQGFRRAHGAVPSGTTMRNLFGQVDGTANPRPGTEPFARTVWIEDGPFAGGTSMVIRRIRMDVDGWDELDRSGREESLGRRLADGSPLTGTAEHDEPDFSATSAHGFPVIGEFTHVRRARGVDAADGGQSIFRRSYNYDLAPDPAAGGISESGQVFVSFQADPLAQFVPIQQRLAELDLMNEWTTPIGSAVFAIPPGAAQGEFLGQSVLE
ncbi:Dyp-type peroxidase [Brachybacterium hainanense]|uniref:Dyp-type peroxidase n=1 Tax=Brachybacterium hainanense TaxID=1541174 RepID=A0ABV6RA12_9MICO